MKQRLTNEQRLRKLLKDLHTYEAAILVERLRCISEATREAIKANPEDFDNPIFNHHHYLAVCDKIDKHFGSDY